MTENELSGIAVDCCYKIHSRLGPGLFETVYKELLSYEFSKLNLKFSSQQGIGINYEGVKFNLGFRADLILEEKIILEIKSIENIGKVHFKQLLTYLKISGLKLGLLINFNEVYIKQGIHRIVNNL